MEKVFEIPNQCQKCFDEISVWNLIIRLYPLSKWRIGSAPSVTYNEVATAMNKMKNGRVVAQMTISQVSSVEYVGLQILRVSPA